MSSHDNDKNIWERIIETIIPLDRSDVLPKNPKKTTQTQVSQPALKVRKTYNAKASVKQKGNVSSPIQPVDRDISRKLDKKQLKIDAKLDLHGLTVARAHDAFNNFIQQCAAQEKKHLIVVTGKGNAEKGTGKIRRELPFWAEKPLISKYIHQLSEPAQNPGRFYIILRIKDKNR